MIPSNIDTNQPFEVTSENVITPMNYKVYSTKSTNSRSRMHMFREEISVTTNQIIDTMTESPFYPNVTEYPDYTVNRIHTTHESKSPVVITPSRKKIVDFDAQTASYQSIQRISPKRRDYGLSPFGNKPSMSTLGFNDGDGNNSSYYYSYYDDSESGSYSPHSETLTNRTDYMSPNSYRQLMNTTMNTSSNPNANPNASMNMNTNSIQKYEIVYQNSNRSIYPSIDSSQKMSVIETKPMGEYVKLENQSIQNQPYIETSIVYSNPVSIIHSSQPSISQSNISTIPPKINDINITLFSSPIFSSSLSTSRPCSASYEETNQNTLKEIFVDQVKSTVDKNNMINFRTSLPDMHENISDIKPQNIKPHSISRREKLSIFSTYHQSNFELKYTKPNNFIPTHQTIDRFSIQKNRDKQKSSLQSISYIDQDCNKLIERLKILVENHSSASSVATSATVSTIQTTITKDTIPTLKKMSIGDGKIENMKPVMEMSPTEKLEALLLKEKQMKLEQASHCCKIVEESLLYMLSSSLNRTRLEKDTMHRHMFDALCMSQYHLPYVLTHRDVQVFSRTPDELINFHFLTELEKKEFLECTKKCNLYSTNERNGWEVFTYHDKKGMYKYRLFRSKRSGQIQKGEPFTFHIRRQGKHLTEQNWSPYEQNVSVLNREKILERGYKLISDKHSGLLIYCPDQDLYISSAIDLSYISEFSELKHCSTMTNIETKDIVQDMAQDTVHSIVNPTIENKMMKQVDHWTKLLSSKIRSNLSNNIIQSVIENTNRYNGSTLRPKSTSRNKRPHSANSIRKKRLGISMSNKSIEEMNIESLKKLVISKLQSHLISDTENTNGFSSSSIHPSSLPPYTLRRSMSNSDYLKTINEKKGLVNDQNIKQQQIRPSSAIGIQRSTFLPNSLSEPRILLQQQYRQSSNNNDSNNNGNTDSNQDIINSMSKEEEYKELANTLIAIQSNQGLESGIQNNQTVSTKQSLSLSNGKLDDLLGSSVAVNESLSRRKRISKRLSSIEAFRRLSIPKEELIQDNIKRKESAAKGRLRSILTEFDMKALMFESALSSSSLTTLHQKLSTLSTTNPLDLSLLLDLSQFFLQHGLGNESLACYQFTLSLSKLKEVDNTIENSGDPLMIPKPLEKSSKQPTIKSKDKSIDTVLCPWPQNVCDSILSQLLELLLLQKYKPNQYPNMNTIKTIIHQTNILISDSIEYESHKIIIPILFDAIARYLKYYKYEKYVEELYIASLALFPLSDRLNQSYAHVLLENNGILSSHHLSLAIKYINRVDSKSVYYPMAKLEIAWLYELQTNITEDIIVSTYQNITKLSKNNKKIQFYPWNIFTKSNVELNRVVSLGQVGLGHYYHMKGNYSKAKELYRDAMYSDSYNYVPYFLLATLPTDNHRENNNSNIIINAADGHMNTMTSTGTILVDTSLSVDEIDACYRRALLSQPVNCMDSSQWLLCFGYSLFLIYVKQDMELGEKYLCCAVNDANSLSHLSANTLSPSNGTVVANGLYPTIALAHYYIYIRKNSTKATELLQKRLYRIQSMEKEIWNKDINQSTVVPSDLSHEKIEVDGNNAEQDNEEDLYSIFITKTSIKSTKPSVSKSSDKGKDRKIPLSSKNYDKEHIRVYQSSLQKECYAIYIVLGYAYYDRSDMILALEQARNAMNILNSLCYPNEKPNISIHPVGNSYAAAYSIVYRLIGLIECSSNSNSSTINISNRNKFALNLSEEALKYFEWAYQTATTNNNISNNNNHYSIRQMALIYALTNKYTLAYNVIESVAIGSTINSNHGIVCTNPMVWKALAIMSYLYKGSVENAILFLYKSCDLCGDVDIESNLLLGQMLLECHRYKEAIDILKRAIRIHPTDALLWAHYAIAMRHDKRNSNKKDDSGLEWNRWKESMNKSMNKSINNSMSVRNQFYDDKFSNCDSLRECIDSEDSDEIIYIAMKLLEKQSDLWNAQSSYHHHHHQVNKISENNDILWSSYHYGFKPKHKHDNHDDDDNNSNYHHEAIYLCAMYYLDQDIPIYRDDSMDLNNDSNITNDILIEYRNQSKSLLYMLIPSIEDNKLASHSMAAFMLGWIEEIEISNKLTHSIESKGFDKKEYVTAEKYYHYAMDILCSDSENKELDIQNLQRLLSAFQDSYEYLHRLYQNIENSIKEYDEVFRRMGKGILSGTIKNIKNSSSRLKNKLKERILTSTLSTSILSDQSTMMLPDHHSNNNDSNSNTTQPNVWYGQSVDMLTEEQENLRIHKQRKMDYINRLQRLEIRIGLHKTLLQTMKTKISHLNSMKSFPNKISEIYSPKNYVQIEKNWITKLMISFAVCEDWVTLRNVII